jgi:hypothetical protein
VVRVVSIQNSERIPNLVSIIELKSLARRMLSPSSTLRNLILSEPDYVPSAEVIVKVRIYSKLLYRELKSSSAH